MFRIIMVKKDGVEELIPSSGENHDTEASAEARIRQWMENNPEWCRGIVLRPQCELLPETRIVRKPLMPQMGGGE